MQRLMPAGIPPGGAGFLACVEGHFYGVVVYPRNDHGVCEVRVFDSRYAEDRARHAQLREDLRERILPSLYQTPFVSGNSGRRQELTNAEIEYTVCLF